MNIPELAALRSQAAAGTSDAAYLSYLSAVRTIHILGIVAVMLSACLGGSMVGMVIVLIQTGKPEIAVVIGMFGTVQSIVTGTLGYLAPSPLQSQRRTADTQPTGTPGDPVSTTVENKPTDPVQVEVSEQPKPPAAVGKWELVRDGANWVIRWTVPDEAGIFHQIAVDGAHTGANLAEKYNTEGITPANLPSE